MRKEDKNTAIYVAYDDQQPHDSAVPEKNLLVAILLNAISDLRKPGDAGRKAVDYFLSPNEDYIFSFQSICDYLAIDPKRILTITGLKNGKKVEDVPQKTEVEASSEQPLVEH